MRKEELFGDNNKRIKLALITKNIHKLQEIQQITKDYPIEFYAAGIPKLEIQADSLELIALTAARYAFETIRRPLVVDDSGLFIEALNGFPGPYSSYTFKTLGIRGILDLMRGKKNRRACFVSVAALIIPPLEKIFSGRICGRISASPRGTHGFGFDPIFIPNGYDQTFAELGSKIKNQISHRAKAFRRLADFLEQLYVPP